MFLKLCENTRDGMTFTHLVSWNWRGRLVFPLLVHFSGIMEGMISQCEQSDLLVPMLAWKRPTNLKSSRQAVVYSDLRKRVNHADPETDAGMTTWKMKLKASEGNACFVWKLCFQDLESHIFVVVGFSYFCVRSCDHIFAGLCWMADGSMMLWTTVSCGFLEKPPFGCTLGYFQCSRGPELIQTLYIL